MIRENLDPPLRVCTQRIRGKDTETQASWLANRTPLNILQAARAPMSAKLGAGVFAVGASAALIAASKTDRSNTEGEAATAGAFVAGAAVGGVASYLLNSDDSDKYKTYWPRKIMMIFGPPGAGKGTQGPRIEALLGIPTISTGDILRAARDAGTEVGNLAKSYMDSGRNVPDEVVIALIKDRIKAEDCDNGFILDGFPRTVVQAKALDKMLAATGECVSNIVVLNVPDSILVERISNRWIHKVHSAPPSACSHPHIRARAPRI